MKPVKLFISSAGAILLAAACERFLVVAGGAPLLAMREPFLGISLRAGVLFVGILELIAAGVCMFGTSRKFQLGWVIWLASNYTVYWICLLSLHYGPQATCIGDLTDPLHVGRGTPGFIINLIPAYLLVGGMAAAALSWREGRKMLAARSYKMSCPGCGGHIRFDARNIGNKMPCPHCQKRLTLSRPDATVKTSCFFCQGHIEFPAHAIGEKMPCPHCNMDITLKEP